MLNTIFLNILSYLSSPSYYSFIKLSKIRGNHFWYSAQLLDFICFLTSFFFFFRCAICLTRVYLNLCNPTISTASGHNSLNPLASLNVTTHWRFSMYDVTQVILRILFTLDGVIILQFANKQKKSVLLFDNFLQIHKLILMVLFQCMLPCVV